MYNFTKFAHNSIGVIVILTLMVVSFVTTLSLSPVGIEDDPGQIAGIHEGTVVDNFKPLILEDRVGLLPEYSSQIVQYSEKSYGIILNIPAHSGGSEVLDLASILNENKVDVSVRITAQVDRNISNSVIVSLGDGKNSFRLHPVSEDKRVQMTIPAANSLELQLGLEYLHNLNFSGEVGILVEVL